MSLLICIITENQVHSNYCDPRGQFSFSEPKDYSCHKYEEFLKQTNYRIWKILNKLNKANAYNLSLIKFKINIKWLIIEMFCFRKDAYLI